MVRENYPLKKHNTFNLDVKARYFAEFKTIQEIKYFLQNHLPTDAPFLVLGGGSNLLFTKDYEGHVLYPGLKGIAVVADGPDDVLMQAMAGEKWDDFVAYCVERGYGGLENLSSIPGNVGAVPIQNIGAYGIEAKDCISEVVALDVNSFAITKFSNSECKFGYRDSIFKNELKGKYIILSVTFKLSKKYQLVTQYGSIEEELAKFGNKNIVNLRNAIIAIRGKKLPDHSVIGNAGSFFKNPVVQAGKLEELRQKFPNIPNFALKGNLYKVPAAWLIEQCGWKGKKHGGVGVYQYQPLVLVNYGNATGEGIYQYSLKIGESVRKKFGIVLEREVMVVSGE